MQIVQYFITPWLEGDIKEQGVNKMIVYHPLTASRSLFAVKGWLVHTRQINDIPKQWGGGGVIGNASRFFFGVSASKFQQYRTDSVLANKQMVPLSPSLHNRWCTNTIGMSSVKALPTYSALVCGLHGESVAKSISNPLWSSFLCRNHTIPALRSIAVTNHAPVSQPPLNTMLQIPKRRFQQWPKQGSSAEVNITLPEIHCLFEIVVKSS